MNPEKRGIAYFASTALFATATGLSSYMAINASQELQQHPNNVLLQQLGTIEQSLITNTSRPYTNSIRDGTLYIVSIDPESARNELCRLLMLQDTPCLTQDTPVEELKPSITLLRDPLEQELRPYRTAEQHWLTATLITTAATLMSTTLFYATQFRQTALFHSIYRRRIFS